MRNLGWKSGRGPCDEPAHGPGLIAGRCAACGKRPNHQARAAKAWAASIIHWEQPSRQKEIHA